MATLSGQGCIKLVLRHVVSLHGCGKVVASITMSSQVPYKLTMPLLPCKWIVGGMYMVVTRLFR